MFRAIATVLFGIVLSVASLSTDLDGQIVSAEHVVVSPGDTVTVGIILDLSGPQAVQGYSISAIVSGSAAAGALRSQCADGSQNPRSHLASSQWLPHHGTGRRPGDW